ncbi:hypothetical protein BDB00DRAFT_856096 [Zychaea mexicana]|uniref:uncharacterized protein n=1 Tax=Zychaea mexicana TaxID=64656 RepID=UPI0022FE828D|nr:uncharacterized protein BDB00DRAFT_856096 [Zychaea mexicana]KAI9484353.1 hypothetical protein BDB00DRAFT_856096 [Zychaea mexicana]
MSSSYDPFIESLVFDTSTVSSSGSTSPETYTEDLELWTNAQFTFDVAPGSAIQDKPSNAPTTTAPTSSTTAANSLLSLNIPQFSTATTDPSNELFKLLGLDHLLQQQQQQLLQHSVPAITTAATTAAGIRAAPPLLLPKVDPSQAKNNNTSPPVPAAKLPNVSTEKRNANNKRVRADEELGAQEREAVEEDKRRRNTAASARFRAKKKVREQAMEQTVKDMAEKSEKLEERVQSLEREIKWLRTLLIEKNKKNDERQETPLAPLPSPTPSSSSSSSLASASSTSLVSTSS